MNIWATWPTIASTGSVPAVVAYPDLRSRLRSESSTSSTIEDELHLSAEGVAVAERQRGKLAATPLLLGMPREADGAVHLEDMRTYCDRQQRSLHARIERVLEQAGVDSTQAIRLEIGFDGNVVVANDHPQRRQIEQLFQKHPELRDQFAEVDALSSVIRAGDEAIAFQRAYARNPYAAVAEYSHLFDGSPRPRFSLLIQRDQFTVDFVSW